MTTRIHTKNSATFTPQRFTTPVMSRLSHSPVAESAESSPESTQEEATFHASGYSFANVKIYRNTSGVKQRKTANSLKVSTLPIQAKLTIGKPGDKYEQEADRVATQIVDQINAPQSQQSSQNETVQISPNQLSDDVETVRMKLTTQHLAGKGGIGAGPGLEASIQQARSGGQRLPDTIRSPMEQAFGANFSGVQIHVDAQSDRLNQSIFSRAFTSKKDIFFQQGAYNPRSRRGQELIAHELAHVVQQEGNTLSSPHSSKMLQNRMSQSGNFKFSSPENTIQRAMSDWTPDQFPNDSSEDLEELKELINNYNKMTNEEKSNGFGIQLLYGIQALAKHLKNPVIPQYSRLAKKPANKSQTQTSYSFCAPLITDTLQEIKQNLSNLKYTDKQIKTLEILSEGNTGVTYKAQDKTDTKKQYVWKPEPTVTIQMSALGIGLRSGGEGINRLSARSVMTWKIAKDLNAGVIVRTRFGFIAGEFGFLMDYAEGKDIHALKSERKSYYQNWQIAKGLYTLQAIDYITGQVDRHWENVFLSKSGVKGIDSDFSFGKTQLRYIEKVPESPYNAGEAYQFGHHNRGIPKYMDVAFYKTLNKYAKSGKFSQRMLGKFTDQEIENTELRLSFLIDRVLTREITLLYTDLDWEGHVNKIQQEKLRRGYSRNPKDIGYFLAIDHDTET